MARRTGLENPFELALKGVAAGLVGTLAMTTALQAVDRLRDARTAAAVESSPQAMPDAADEEAFPPTEQVADRLAQGIFRTRLSRGTRRRLGVGVYWGYGAFWGALSAQLQMTARPPALWYGLVLGLFVWLIGPMRLVPALRLYVRPTSTGFLNRLISVGLHLVFGTVTALTLERLDGRPR